MSVAEETGATRVEVRSAGGGYDVLVGPGLLQRLPVLLEDVVDAGRFAIISDSNVAPLHGDAALEVLREAGLDAALFTFPAGEASKTRKSWSILTDELLEAGFGRDACVVAVGGGVTTDLAGFVAATYLRGIPVVQVPTSYLAMIDASVGGKTGVDVKAGKNLVGAFHPPRLVVADPEVISTLPSGERAQGLVEALKHGAILDLRHYEELVQELDALLDANPVVATSLIADSVSLKAAVVTEDEFESGYRQVLNFGHTLGHALEAASGYALGHGSAVAWGMLLEAEVGERMGITEPGTRARLEPVLSPFAGSLPSSIALGEVLPYLRTDKKVRGGKPRVVLLRRIGEVDPGTRWSHEAPEELLEAVLREALERA